MATLSLFLSACRGVVHNLVREGKGGREGTTNMARNGWRLLDSSFVKVAKQNRFNVKLGSFEETSMVQKYLH